MVLSRAKKRFLTFSGVLLLVSPLLLEGLVRVRGYLRHGSLLEVDDLYERHPDADLRVPIANLSVQLGGHARIDIDSRGFRSPEVTVPKPPGTVRLAFLGGSTTFCAQAASNATTWPSRLVEALAVRYPDVAFDHVNAGVTGASVADSAVSLEHRIRAIEPDIVVVYHAAKDLADDTYVLALERGLVEPRSEPGWWTRHSLLCRLLAKNAWYADQQRAGRGDRAKLDVDFGPLADAFGRRLDRLARRATEVADAVVLATFSTKVRRGQARDEQLDNLAQSFTFTPYLTPAAILDGYAAYNRAIAAVATALGSERAILVDGADDISADAEHFHDTVHFTEAGYAAMAARVERALVASSAFERVVARVRAEGAVGR